MRDIGDLRQRQSLPLQAKVYMSQARIREWYDHYEGNVCVSFSGGKDSTVLAHLVHDLYPEVPLVFCNTGLEYPEIQSFAHKMGAEFIRPKMSFSEVISTYGYPIISKENAEAIYYARKICNGGGKQKKENEPNSQEEELPGLRFPHNLVGGGIRETKFRRASMTAVPYRFIKAELDGDGQRSKENLSQNLRGGYNETFRRRADITATREQFDRAGVAQIGINGDESASPG